MAQQYTGRWKEIAYRDPLKFNDRRDPAHAITDAPDPDALTYATPPMPDVGNIGEYPGMEFFAPLPGVVVDHTPDTHDNVPRPAAGDDREMQAISQNAHAQDHGASRGQNLGTHHLDFYDEHQVHTVVEGFGPGSTHVDPVAQMRGLNGLAENNPDGFRPGATHLWRFDRKFRTGERRHDHRPVTLNLPYLPVNAPHVPADRFTSSNSPFDSLARPITRFFNRPAVRREPQGISEGYVSDEAGGPSQIIGSDWVM